MTRKKLTHDGTGGRYALFIVRKNQIADRLVASDNHMELYATKVMIVFGMPKPDRDGLEARLHVVDSQAEEVAA